jgi:amino acid efflux transporter
VTGTTVPEAGAGGTGGADSGRMAGHLHLPGATALAITVVVGSGALVSPGVAYHQAGRAAIYAWLIAAAVTVPLLVIFARLGGEMPNAGGVAGFVQSVFGRQWAAGIEVLVLGTFSLGIPAIALTGGHYFRQLPGLEATPAWLAALGLLLLAGMVTAIGGSVSTRTQIVLALAMTAGLIAVAVVGIAAGPSAGQPPAMDLESVGIGITSIGAVFFAFTGWEMLSFTTEEYAHPRRDFPRVMIISFVTVTGIYLLLAWAVQTQLAQDASDASSAPLHAVMAAAVPGIAPVVSVLGVVIIAANLVGAIWAASRLTMSSAREGLLPRPLARLSQAHGTPPRRAVLTCMLVFGAVVVATTSNLVSMPDLLTVAGQNFFLLYLFAAAVYCKHTAGPRRGFGVVVTLVLAGLAATFDPWQLVYAIALLLIGAALARRRGRRAAGDEVR